MASMTGAPLLPGLEDLGLPTRFKKYKKVLSSSPLSSGTYVLETDSEEEDVFPPRNEEEDDIFLQNRLKDFEELNQGIEEILRELGDSGDEGQEGRGQGLWEISEPELVSDSDAETAEVNIVVPGKFKNLTKKRNTVGSGLNKLGASHRLRLDFDARGDSPSRRSTVSSDSGGKGGVPHFGSFSSIRRGPHQNLGGKEDQRQSQRQSKTADKSDATKSTSSSKKPCENGPRKQSLPTRIKSAIGGFTFAKKKTGEARQRQRVL